MPKFKTEKEFKEIEIKEPKDYGKRYAAVSVAAATAIAAAPIIGGVVVNRRRKALDYGDAVSVQGAELVTASGEKLQIAGINLNDYVFGCRDGNDIVEGGSRGAFNSLKKRFGDYGAREIFGKSFENAVMPADVKELAKLGVNCVRLPLRSFLLFRNEKVTKKSDPLLKRLDKFVNKCAKAGIYVIFTCEDAPGLNPENGEYSLFELGRHSFSKRNEFVRMCSEISTHYKDNPALLGYEIPFDSAMEDKNGKRENIYKSLCIRTAKALRTLNDTRPVFIHPASIPEDTAEFADLGIALMTDIDSPDVPEFISAAQGKLPCIVISEGGRIADSTYTDGFVGVISGFYKGGNPDTCLYSKPKDFIDVTSDSYDEICEKVASPSKTENYMKMN